MATKFVNLSWQFDRDEFARDLSRAMVEIGDASELAQLLDMSKAAICHYARTGATTEQFPYPSMTVFLKICNALNLDPRKYFIAA